MQINILKRREERLLPRQASPQPRCLFANLHINIIEHDTLTVKIGILPLIHLFFFSILLTCNYLVFKSYSNSWRACELRITYRILQRRNGIFGAELYEDDSNARVDSSGTNYCAFRARKTSFLRMAAETRASHSRRKFLGVHSVPRGRETKGNGLLSQWAQ